MGKAYLITNRGIKKISESSIEMHLKSDVCIDSILCRHHSNFGFKIWNRITQEAFDTYLRFNLEYPNDILLSWYIRDSSHFESDIPIDALGVFRWKFTGNMISDLSNIYYSDRLSAISNYALWNFGLEIMEDENKIDADFYKPTDLSLIRISENKFWVPITTLPTEGFVLSMVDLWILKSIDSAWTIDVKIGDETFNFSHGNTQRPLIDHLYFIPRIISMIEVSKGVPWIFSFYRNNDPVIIIRNNELSDLKYSHDFMSEVINALKSDITNFI